MSQQTVQCPVCKLHFAADAIDAHLDMEEQRQVQKAKMLFRNTRDTHAGDSGSESSGDSSEDERPSQRIARSAGGMQRQDSGSALPAGHVFFQMTQAPLHGLQRSASSPIMATSGAARPASQPQDNGGAGAAGAAAASPPGTFDSNGNYVPDPRRLSRGPSAADVGAGVRPKSLTPGQMATMPPPISYEQHMATQHESALGRAAETGLKSWLGLAETQSQGRVSNRRHSGESWSRAMTRRAQETVQHYDLDPRWQGLSMFDTYGRSALARSNGPDNIHYTGPPVPDVPGDDALDYGQDALADLNRSSAAIGSQSRRQRLNNAMILRYRPYFIWSMTAVQLGMLVLSIVLNRGFEDWRLNPWFGPSLDVLIVLGAKDGQRIRNGEIWRLVTPIFNHVGVIHFGMNMMFQWKVGLQLERLYGPLRVGTIYMLAGIGGNLLSVVFLPTSIQVGASGSLYGILGVLLSDLLQNWRNLRSPGRNVASLLTVTLVSLAIGLLPAVDNFAHVGGFIVGMLCAVIVLPTVTFGRSQAAFKICLVVIALPLLILYFAVLIAVFYLALDANDWCQACRMINCLPYSNWCEI